MIASVMKGSLYGLGTFRFPSMSVGFPSHLWRQVLMTVPHQVAAFHGHDEQMTMQVYSHGEDFTGLLEVMAR